MEFPEWFRKGWWAVLLIAIGVILWRRIDVFLSGQAGTSDLILFVIWVALMLVPIFSEIGFGTLSLKAHIAKAKTEVVEQIRSSIRAELRQDVNVHNYYAPPPPDSVLPSIERTVNEVALQVTHAAPSSTGNIDPRGIVDAEEPAETQKENDALYLAAIRRKIEKEVRNLAYIHLEISDRSSFGLLVNRLVAASIIPEQLEQPLRVVYSVCSKALHGDDVTDSQMGFVRDTQAQLIRTLRGLSAQRLDALSRG